MNENVNEWFHAGILSLLMKDDLLEDKANLVSFIENDNKLKCAYIRGRKDKNISVVLNCPTITDKLFITVSDGNPENIARVMSHLEEVDSNSCLHKNDVSRFDYSYLKERNKIGVIILDIKISPVLRRLGEAIELKGRRVSTFLVVFINQEEYEYWKKNGHNALMEYFIKNDKDLVSI